MSTTDKCLKETSDYSAEDARFMEMGCEGRQNQVLI